MQDQVYKLKVMKCTRVQTDSHPYGRNIYKWNGINPVELYVIHLTKEYNLCSMFTRTMC